MMNSIKYLYISILSFAISFFVFLIPSFIFLPEFLNAKYMKEIYKIESNPLLKPGYTRIIFSSVILNSQSERKDVNYYEFVNYMNKSNDKLGIIYDKLDNYLFIKRNTEITYSDFLLFESKNIKKNINSSKDWEKYKKDNFINSNSFPLTAFETARYFDLLSKIQNRNIDDVKFISFVSVSSMSLAITLVLMIFSFSSKAKGIGVVDDIETSNDDEQTSNDEIKPKNKNVVNMSSRNLIDKISNHKEMKSYYESNRSVGFNNDFLKKRELSNNPKVMIESKNNLNNYNKNHNNDFGKKEINKISLFDSSIKNNDMIDTKRNDDNLKQFNKILKRLEKEKK